MTSTPPGGAVIGLDDIALLGKGLSRPECVLCTSNGRVFVANARGGVTILEPDGSQTEHLARDPGFELMPNGICLMRDGSVLLAHLGAETGGVFRLTGDGGLEPFVTEAEGEALPPTNYVHADAEGRVWITVSTRLVPRAKGYRPDVAVGFVVLVDAAGARVVADGLGYANECIVHPDGRRLFVNETFGKRLTAFDIGEDGRLSNRATIAEFGHGDFPDGLTFDREGGVWITSVVSNRVIRLSPDGRARTLVIEDNDPSHVDRVEAAFRAGAMGRPHLDAIPAQKLRNISSLAFGGADLRRIHLGCLLGESIYVCDAPIAGHPPAHWFYDGPRPGPG